MTVAIAITRTDLTAAELRAAAARSRDAQAARRMLALALVLEGVDRKTAAETCGMDRQTLRDWVHRYNAEGLAGLANRRGAARPRRLDPGAGGRARGLAGGRPRPGGGRGGALAAAGPATPDRGPVRGGVARADGRQVSGGARLPPALGAPAPSEDRSRGAGALSKKLPRGGSRGDPRGGPRQAARDLVPGRGAGRPAGHAHPGLGEARHPAAGAARHPLPVGLHLRRGLPGARRGGGPRPALRRHRRDERPPRRDRPHRRARRPCRARARRRRLARRARARRAGQHLPRPAPALQPGAEPGRERLAVPARQLARDQRLRRLRRHRRRLLRRMEPLRQIDPTSR